VSKGTSKLQVTIPKAIADRYRISPGDELAWIPAADSVRVVPAKALARPSSTAARLRLFDAATQRQRLRQSERPREQPSVERGWTREDLYRRGSAG
jgi:bifunctional DNA-binding transcriptional regulator/antitoxin component of YhaV-PrlF toxin-antitoxin module